MHIRIPRSPATMQSYCVALAFVSGPVVGLAVMAFLQMKTKVPRTHPITKLSYMIRELPKLKMMQSPAPVLRDAVESLGFLPGAGAAKDVMATVISDEADLDPNQIQILLDVWSSASTRISSSFTEMHSYARNY